MINFIAIFLGGGIGASCRYLITKLCTKFFGFSQFGTFGANIIGCFLIGLVFSLTMTKTNLFPIPVKLFITVGFLGGLTTFSTFSCEAFCFLKDGKIWHCLLYVALSFLFGLFATAAGYLIGKQL